MVALLRRLTNSALRSLIAPATPLRFPQVRDYPRRAIR